MRAIRPTNNNGSIRIKFTLRGHHYQFQPIPGGKYGDPRDRRTAEAICTRIQNDILAENFDSSLERYRVVTKATLETPKAKPPETLLEAFDLWLASKGVSAQSFASTYAYLYGWVKQANPVLTDTSWFAARAKGLSPVTYRDRLALAKRLGAWIVSQGYLTYNPFESLKSPRVSRTPLQPFTKDEIQAIALSCLELYPHYYPFTLFLLATGCRAGEVIGLRWRYLDLEQGSCTIAETYSRDVTQNGYRRRRKGTKSGTIRTFQLPAKVLEVLKGLPVGSPEDLVFTTKRGMHIHLDDYRKRVWKPLLEYLGIPYRKIHNARHSVASHALDQGASIPDVAYLLGHSDNAMVLKVYGHHIGSPEPPNLF